MRATHCANAPPFWPNEPISNSRCQTANAMPPGDSCFRAPGVALSPFSCSLAGEGDEAPGGAGRLGERPADRGAVRHAPWRRRVHPNDVGVRRLPALHRGAAGRATFSRADSAAVDSWATSDPRCIDPFVHGMFFSSPSQVPNAALVSSVLTGQRSCSISDPGRQRAPDASVLRPGRGAALTQARSQRFRAAPKMGSPESNEPTASNGGPTS